MLGQSSVCRRCNISIARIVLKLTEQLAGMQCLKEDTSHVLDLLVELLMTPALPEDKIQLNKNQVVDFRDRLTLGKPPVKKDSRGNKTIKQS